MSTALPPDFPLEEVREILLRNGVRLAYLFGSSARAQAGPVSPSGGDGRGGFPDSDVDIAVLMPEPWSPRQTLDFIPRLALALKPLFALPVDITVLNEASPLLGNEAVLQGVPVWAQEDEQRIRYELKLWGQYEDFRHIQSFFVEALRQRLSKSA